MHRGFSASKDVVWFQQRVTPGTTWRVTVTDADTSFSGPFAGNGCSIRADLLHDAGAR